MVSLKLQKRLASSVLKCVRSGSTPMSPIYLDVHTSELEQFTKRSQFVYNRRGGIYREILPKSEYLSKAPYTFHLAHNDLTVGYFTKKIEAYDPDPKERFTAAMQRLQIFSPNKLEEKEKSKFLGFMWNPLSWVMEAAAIMAIALANGGGKPSDWQDFVGIITLLVINSTIRFIEENNAGNAAAVLMARLVPKAKILRDGRWTEEDVAILVPGDVISIKLRDIIPADAPLLE